MIEIVKLKNIFALEGALQAIEDERLYPGIEYWETAKAKYFPQSPVSDWGRGHQTMLKVLRDHAKGCDCMDCGKIEQ